MSGPGQAVAPPSLARSWYVVFILCALFVWSYADRLILGLLAVDVGRDLAIGDSQLGLLVGTSFALVYAIGGVPLANMLDTGDRRKLVTIGCLVWSTATILSGFASGFYQLAVLRMGVAIGEAVLTPAAISMIADLFRQERRATPTTLYASMGALMGVGGLALCGVVVELAQWLAPSLGMVSWRLALVICGLPSLALITIFWLTVKEPVREIEPKTPGTDGASDISFDVFIRHLRDNAGFYAPLLLGCAVSITFNFAFLTWTPTVFIRVFHVGAATAGYEVGLVGLTGILGAFLWSRAAVWSHRKGVRHNTLIILAVGGLVTLPVGLVTFLLPGSTQMLVSFAALCISSASIVIIMPLVVQTYGPPRMRARLIALVYLSYSLVGYGLGPVSATLLARFWPDDPRSIGYGMSLLAAICLPIGSAFFWLAFRNAKRMPE